VKKDMDVVLRGIENYIVASEKTGKKV